MTLDRRHDRIIDDIAEVCEMLNLDFERAPKSTPGADLIITKDLDTILIEVQRRWHADEKTWQNWVQRYQSNQTRAFIVVSTHSRQLRRKASDFFSDLSHIYFINEATWQDILPALLIKYLL